eukprot:PITA_16402
MEEKPSILFLQETKCSLIFLEKAAAKAWPGGQVIAVDSQGASGGLAILWDARKIQLNNIHANKNFIQAIFHLLGTNIYGHLTNVYFPQETQQKAAILNTIAHLNQTRQHSLWVSGGDFNMTASSEEKMGGRCRSNKDGGEFTAHIIPFSGSDHWPIEMLWNRPGNNLKKPFRFEDFWLSHPDFKEFITTTWQNCNPIEQSKMARFQKKLKMLKGEIKKWNKQTFGNIFKEKEKTLQELKAIQQRLILEGRTEELVLKEQEMEGKLLEREQQEEVLWKQKSRIR